MIFIRGLKSAVTNQQLRTELSKFGDIKSLTLNAHDSLTEEGEDDKRLQFAVIGFKTEDAANEALSIAWKSEVLIGFSE